MKEVVVISGKGGTGKTSITASLAVLLKDKVIADCDVDAPDLHLILHPKIKESFEFRGGKRAVHDPAKCVNCNLCYEHCRYDAVSPMDYSVDPYKCEGCGVCAVVCPVDAMTMVENLSGYSYISDTDYGTMVHAKLNIAEENSGKLVTTVRNLAKKIAREQGKNMILIDGPPGIGCPVTSSLTGANLAVIVTEPTKSGIHDLERVLTLIKHFRVKGLVVVNRFDLNPELTGEIKDYCMKKGLEVIAEIPFDPIVTHAMVQGKSVVQFAPEDNTVVREIRKIAGRVTEK